MCFFVHSGVVRLEYADGSVETKVSQLLLDYGDEFRCKFCYSVSRWLVMVSSYLGAAGKAAGFGTVDSWARFQEFAGPAAPLIRKRVLFFFSFFVEDKRR